jgi:hypothetical protein
VLVSFLTGFPDFFHLSQPAVSANEEQGNTKDQNVVYTLRVKKKQGIFSFPLLLRNVYRKSCGGAEDDEHLQGLPFRESKHGGRGKYGCGSACEVRVYV